MVYEAFEYPIEFEENKVNVICIEKPECFREFIEDLQEQIEDEEGKFVLSEDGEELSFKKSVYLVTDLFNLEFNERKVLNQIYERLDEYAGSEEMYLQTCEMQSHLYEYLEKLMGAVDYPLAYSQQVDLTDLYKAVELKVQTEYENLLEKLIDYMEMLVQIFNLRCMVFVHLKSFLEESELEELYKAASYKKVNLLLLENRDYEQKNEREKMFLWDKDLCEIY